MRSPASLRKFLIFDTKHRQAISDQHIRSAFQPATKRVELDCLCLQSSICKQILHRFFFKTHISSQLTASHKKLTRAEHKAFGMEKPSNDKRDAIEASG